MSLQTGQPLCKLASPIINPYDLRIVAFYVDGPRLDFSPAVVFTEDIREFGPMGAIVDSVDNIMSPEGMVRLNEVISYNFTLNHLLVILLLRIHTKMKRCISDSLSAQLLSQKRLHCSNQLFHS